MFEINDQILQIRLVYPFFWPELIILLAFFPKTLACGIKTSILTISQFYFMSEFTKNFFLCPREERTVAQPRSPSNRTPNPNKKVSCLYLANVIKSKINKELSFGLGKIMMEGLPKFPFKKINQFVNESQSDLYSTQVSSLNVTPISTPKNEQKLKQPAGFPSKSKLLKKRSSLNETRPVLQEKEQKLQIPTMNPERTYQAHNAQKDKQLNGFKMMQLSGTTRTILEKINRYDKRNYVYELQKLCKDDFNNEMRKLEKIKNSSKQLRGEVYDNQLTMAVLCNNIKLISELNKEVIELRKSNEQNQKQLKRKKDQHLRLHKSSQKLEKHMGNVESQMKNYMTRIEEHLGNRELNKALIGINQFVKKYEGEEFSKERIHFYNLLKERIVDYREIEKCLDEVCRILGVLCVADLNQTDACLRSLNANHTSFKYIKKTYGNIDKFYGRQMNNILHNLLNFNNNIIQYLETKKQVQKQMNKPTGIEELKQGHNAEVAALNAKLEEQKRKIALLELDIEKKNYKLNNMDPLLTITESSKKVQTEFEKRMTDIMQLIVAKKDEKKQLDLFRKNPILLAQKPYSQFINFISALQRSNQERIKQEMQSLSSTFNDISKIFRKDFESQEARFKELNKLLDASSKKNVFYFDLHRFLQSLMLTIVKKTKDDATDRQSKVSNNERLDTITIVPAQKKRERRFSQNFEDMRFDMTTVKGGKTCVSKQSPPKSVGFFDEEQQDLGLFDQKDLLKKVQLFLNKTSPILHKPGMTMEDKLSEVEQLTEKFILNHGNYKQFFTSLENWMSFAISRLELK